MLSTSTRDAKAYVRPLLLSYSDRALIQCARTCVAQSSEFWLCSAVRRIGAGVIDEELGKVVITEQGQGESEPSKQVIFGGYVLWREQWSLVCELESARYGTAVSDSLRFGS